MFVGICAELSVLELTSLRDAALLHDIGKIHIPKCVLNKPGKLSESEFAVVKQHPENGGKIIGQTDFDEDIAAGIMSHHEYYGGDGYPFGISGENIHYFGRIISIADAFDAMVSLRPYRKKVKRHDEALAEIMDHMGCQFDPYIVRKITNQTPQIIYQGILGFSAQCK